MFFGIDLVKARNNLTNQKEWWLNCVCWGTGYQQVWRLGGDDSKEASSVWNAFVKCWTRIFGEPEILVVDPGLEFAGHFGARLLAV